MRPSELTGIWDDVVVNLLTKAARQEDLALALSRLVDAPFGADRDMG